MYDQPQPQPYPQSQPQSQNISKKKKSNFKNGKTYQKVLSIFWV